MTMHSKLTALSNLATLSVEMERQKYIGVTWIN